jgi:hypothetical protein
VEFEEINSTHGSVGICIFPKAAFMFIILIRDIFFFFMYGFVNF